MPRAKTPKTPKNGSARSKQALTASKSNSNSAPADLEWEIRARAYQLYVERGCTPGREHEDWLVAEKEVKAKRAVAGA